jgi:hypothetical protein
MKTKHIIHRALALALLSAAVALAGIAMAQHRPTSDPAPVIVKNGAPGPSSSNSPIWNQVDGAGILSFKRGGAEPTNLHLQAYFAKVEVDANNNLFLSNVTSTPATNYFSPGSSFNGNQTLAFGAVTNLADWAYADFELDDSVFETNNRGDSLLLFLGKSGDYEAAYVYSVDSPVSSTNYFCSPIATGKDEYLKTEQTYYFNIHAPGGASTNMNIRAYLVQVQTNQSGNFYLTNVPLAQSHISTNNYLKSGANLFDGTTPVPIVPNGTSKVEFALNADEFDVNGQGDCYLVFLGSSTNSGAKLDVAYTFLVRP